MNFWNKKKLPKFSLKVSKNILEKMERWIEKIENKTKKGLWFCKSEKVSASLIRKKKELMNWKKKKREIKIDEKFKKKVYNRFLGTITST